ncbi:MAG: SpoIIE family protein phosphatase [Actinomycetota bacterium]|nr:SpoIIE family protein phosphatase [Actinomycetota bacterium]
MSIATEVITRVLLVEDDPGDALLTTELLGEAAHPFAVRSASKLSEALEHLHGGVECVLLDLGLPDATGLDALDQILTAAPGVAVIVLTGRADHDLALAAVARGAQDYLRKGQLDTELLSRSVRYAVERKRSEDAARRLLANELLAAESARLERGLLARPMLDTSDLAAATRYRSGGGSLLLGGDFYDAIELADGSVRIIIGDVAGHGADEAAIGVALRIAWRGLVLAGLPAEAVFTSLQAVLDAERPHEAMFATACDATIAPDRRSVVLRVAGHPPPLLIADEVRTVAVREPGPPLGVGADGGWDARAITLPARWSLLFYTDGIIEGRSIDGANGRLGIPGLVRAVPALASRARDLGELLDELLALAEQCNGGPVADDIALFLISAR